MNKETKDKIINFIIDKDLDEVDIKSIAKEYKLNFKQLISDVQERKGCACTQIYEAITDNDQIRDIMEAETVDDLLTTIEQKVSQPDIQGKTITVILDDGTTIKQTFNKNIVDVSIDED